MQFKLFKPKGDFTIRILPPYQEHWLMRIPPSRVFRIYGTGLRIK